MTSPATLNMEIPNGPAVNFMIGKGGASIRDMQAKSNCHIAVQKEAEVMPGATMRLLTITGQTDAQCNYCSSLIQARIAEYKASQNQADPRSQLAIAAAASGAYPAPSAAYPPPAYPGYPPPYGYGAPVYPPPYPQPVSAQPQPLPGDGGSITFEITHGPEVNHLIGVKGANINAIQAETGTHVAVQKVGEMAPGATMREIVITGADEAARQRCAALVKKKVQEHKEQYQGVDSSVSLPVSSEATRAMVTAVAQQVAANQQNETSIDIPNGPEVNHLIGVKGASINYLQAETGCHISVQKADQVPPGVTTRLVTVTGEANARARCIELVKAKVAEYSTPREDGESSGRSAKRMRSEYSMPPAYAASQGYPQYGAAAAASHYPPPHNAYPPPPPPHQYPPPPHHDPYHAYYSYYGYPPPQPPPPGAVQPPGGAPPRPPPGHHAPPDPYAAYPPPPYHYPAPPPHGPPPPAGAHYPPPSTPDNRQPSCRSWSETPVSPDPYAAYYQQYQQPAGPQPPPGPPPGASTAYSPSEYQPSPSAS